MMPVKRAPYETVNLVMAHIKAHDATIRQCSVELGLPRTCVWRAIQSLRGLKLIHVTAWDRATSGRNDSAIFTWGEGDDAPEGTYRGMRQNAAIDEPLPVPRPQLGPWGMVW